jgi:glyoxylase-like metal-dependent hydrolase (beta-lactamase superfamily II)
LPNNSLRYVFVYALLTEQGPYLVDTGWNTEEAFEALDVALGSLGGGIDRVQGIVVTHLHPDHYGLAGRIRERSGAWIALHPADAALIHDRYEEPEELLEKVGTMLRRMGAPTDEAEALTRASMPVLPLVAEAMPDVLLEDGERPDIPGWNLEVVWTPGHSPGHICLWEPHHRLMFSGDHVLPRITPNISYHPQAGADPLGDFLVSLDRMLDFDAAEVLPAHEHRFVGLAARVAQLRAHHEQRFAEVLAAIEGGRTAAWDIAACMRWSRPWDRIEGFMRRAAVSEALAHLRTLEQRGLVVEIVGEPSRWEIVSSA